MAQNEARRVRQPEEQRHQRHTRHLRSEPYREPRLEQSAEKEFLHQSHLDEEPRKTERQTDDELAGVKFTAPDRCRAVTHEKLKDKNRGAERKHDRQMITRQRLQAGALQTEIA